MTGGAVVSYYHEGFPRPINGGVVRSYAAEVAQKILADVQIIFERFIVCRGSLLLCHETQSGLHVRRQLDADKS